MNKNLERYGFKPHGAMESTSEATKKTVSTKVSPEVWDRWKRAQQRLAVHGEISMAAVVLSAFLRALDELEADAQTLEAASGGRGSK